MNTVSAPVPAMELRGVSVNFGSVKALPPTLMLQYHFIPNGTIRPYAGVGLNYTRISGVNLHVPTVGRLTLDSDSFQSISCSAAIGANASSNLCRPRSKPSSDHSTRIRNRPAALS